ncbi:hypothetical protein [Sphingomonas sp. DC2300-3]|uniref:type II toxin-antitoxin system RelB family antitoxin n=1 Tax=unclassified Sphingomonas TaxID=196159 RepID=UPI003CEC3D58
MRSVALIRPYQPGRSARNRSITSDQAAASHLCSACRYDPLDFTHDRPNPIGSEFATSEDAAAHGAWFRAKVERAMASTAPKIPHDQVMAEARRIIDRHRTT